MENVFNAGWNGVKKAKEDIEMGLWKFWVPADESRVLRFLTLEPVTYYQHTIRTASQKWESTICTQHDCPLCQQGEKKSFVGSFLVLVRPHQNKGKDIPARVRIYTPSMRVLTQLEKFPLDAECEALDTGDIRVSRSGTGTTTAYTFMPKPGKLTEDDKKTIRESLHIDEISQAALKEVLVDHLKKELEDAKTANSKVSADDFSDNNADIPF